METLDTLWTVILAGGEGRRFAPLARSLHGEDLPKQYAVVVGQRSLLQQTMERMAEIVPARQVVVVAQRGREETTRAHLARWPEAHVVGQAGNRGTGPAVLLGLAHVLRRAPDAAVAIVPCDHYIPRPRPFLEAVSDVARMAGHVPVTLLGVRPDRPETQYGWIAPGPRVAGALCLVRRFVEKPSLPLAKYLLAEGALWNTMVAVGTVEDLWAMTAKRLPQQASAVAAGVWDGDAAGEWFSEVGPADFSRDVLAHARPLGVWPLETTGWTDWGSAERVFASLRGNPDLDELVARIDAEATRRAC